MVEIALVILSMQRINQATRLKKTAYVKDLAKTKRPELCGWCFQSAGTSMLLSSNEVSKDLADVDATVGVPGGTVR